MRDLFKSLFLWGGKFWSRFVLSPLNQNLSFCRSSGSSRSSCLPVPARQTGRICSFPAVKPLNSAKGRTSHARGGQAVKLLYRNTVEP
jgi:hypothetical protein